VASTFSRRNAEIDRFLSHAREPFDDAQLTALSNLCEPSSSVAANAVLARRRPADAVTRARRLRFVAPQHLLFAARPSRPHRGRRRPPPSPLPRAVRRLCSASRRRRQPQERGPQPSRLDARASAVQRHRARRCRQAGRPRD
jgi:hypothetical protein